MTYGAYVANVQLSLHVGPRTCGAGAIVKAFDSYGNPSQTVLNNRRCTNPEES